MFLTFEYREFFILDKLKLGKQVIHEVIEAYAKSREGADALTKDILALNTRRLTSRFLVLYY